MLGYLMVARCPLYWRNKEIAHACVSTNYSADPLTALPVVDRDLTTNVTYANTYCAIYHDKSRDLHMWSIRIANRKPNRSEPSLQDIKFADAIWNVETIGHIKKCIVTPAEASTRPETRTKRLCRSYANAILIRDKRKGFI